MTDEVFKPDANFKAGGLVGGVSSSENGQKLVLRINPTTKRLLVDSSASVTDIVPGTEATNLGKAIDNVVGATDTGIALLAMHNSDVAHLTTAEGDYDILRLANFGGLQVAPEQHHVINSMNAAAGWTVLSDSADNIATTKKHVLGTDALTFDKVDGSGSALAGIQKTIVSVDLGAPSPHDLIQTACYIPDITNVSYVFVRLGTDSSNYNEWRIEDTSLTSALFQTLIFNVGDANYAGITGNGWDPSAVTYAVVGVAFDAETNALAGIVFDELSFHTNLHTSSELNAEVSSSVSSANVNLHKIGGSSTDKGSGNASNGSQRVVIATDDINLAAIKTSIESIDGAIIGPGEPTVDSYAHVAINLGAANDQLLVASAANKQIWVYGITYTCSVAGTVSFQDEDNTAITGIMDHAAKSGLNTPPPGNFAMPIWKLATNKDLEVDVVTAAIDGWLDYAIVSV